MKSVVLCLFVVVVVSTAPPTVKSEETNDDIALAHMLDDRLAAAGVDPDSRRQFIEGVGLREALEMQPQPDYPPTADSAPPPAQPVPQPLVLPAPPAVLPADVVPSLDDENVFYPMEAEEVDRTAVEPEAVFGAVGPHVDEVEELKQKQLKELKLKDKFNARLMEKSEYSTNFLPATRSDVTVDGGAVTSPDADYRLHVRIPKEVEIEKWLSWGLLEGVEYDLFHAPTGGHTIYHVGVRYSRKIDPTVLYVATTPQFLKAAHSAIDSGFVRQGNLGQVCWDNVPSNKLPVDHCIPLHDLMVMSLGFEQKGVLHPKPPLASLAIGVPKADGGGVSAPKKELAGRGELRGSDKRHTMTTPSGWPSTMLWRSWW